MMKFVVSLFLLAGQGLAFSPAFRKQPEKTSSTRLYEYGASSTSFYTTTEKQDSYMSLEDVLGTKCADPKVRQVIQDMLDVCAEITEALRSALVTVEGSMNDFGDAQLSVDVIADNLLWDAVKSSKVVREGASEEEPEVKNVDESGDGDFTVCWDPLDGEYQNDVVLYVFGCA
jgi:sedoheptulose-bisphosphatase